MTNESRRTSLTTNKVICALLLLLLASSPLLRSQGARLTVSMGSSKEIVGELLSVRDSMLVISVGKMSVDVRPPVDPSTILFLRNQDIQKVKLEGKSKVLDGMGKGILYGGLGGAVIGFLSGDDPPGGFLRFTAGDKALLLGVTFAAAGLVIGTVIGAASSTGEQELAPLPNGDFSVLSRLARYPFYEPPWLRSMW